MLRRLHSVYLPRFIDHKGPLTRNLILSENISRENRRRLLQTPEIPTDDLQREPSKVKTLVSQVIVLNAGRSH
jgi:hypothetical protein